MSKNKRLVNDAEEVKIGKQIIYEKAPSQKLLMQSTELIQCL